jgi:hypothetical protein
MVRSERGKAPRHPARQSRGVRCAASGRASGVQGRARRTAGPRRLRTGRTPGLSSRHRGLDRWCEGRLDEAGARGNWCLSWIRRTPVRGVRWSAVLERRPSGQPPHESQMYTKFWTTSSHVYVNGTTGSAFCLLQSRGCRDQGPGAAAQMAQSGPAHGGHPLVHQQRLRCAPISKG